LLRVDLDKLNTEYAALLRSTCLCPAEPGPAHAAAPTHFPLRSPPARTGGGPWPGTSRFGHFALPSPTTRLAELEGHEFTLAFPSVDHHPSTVICRKAGFDLAETVSSEYPPGSKRSLTVSVWVLTLPSGGVNTFSSAW